MRVFLGFRYPLFTGLCDLTKSITCPRLKVNTLKRVFTKMALDIDDMGLLSLNVK
jgi:hypothetical protein